MQEMTCPAELLSAVQEVIPSFVYIRNVDFFFDFMTPVDERLITHAKLSMKKYVRNCVCVY